MELNQSSCHSWGCTRNNFVKFLKQTKTYVDLESSRLIWKLFIHLFYFNRYKYIVRNDKRIFKSGLEHAPTIVVISDGLLVNPYIEQLQGASWGCLLYGKTIFPTSPRNRSHRVRTRSTNICRKGFIPSRPQAGAAWEGQVSERVGLLHTLKGRTPLNYSGAMCTPPAFNFDREKTK